jgi:tRNA threonylcarbamoyladenosine biosynthesis protein TsaB
MIILTLKTDQPEAELCLYNDNKLLKRENWAAHRQLAETVHIKIAELLKSESKNWHDIEGIVCFKGPGSFTGLRIGLSLANATAYGVNAKIVSEQGDNWQQTGIKRLLAGESEVVAMPEYGAEAHITQQRK